MKINILILSLTILISCNGSKENQPPHLVDKGRMVDIMYEMAIYNAIRNQKPMSFEGYDNSFFHYIKKKYKVDSAQFVRSNSYYAKDYKEYKNIYAQVVLKVDTEKKRLDSLIAIKEKKSVKKIKKTVTKKDSLSTKSLQKRLEEAAKKDNEGIVN